MKNFLNQALILGGLFHIISFIIGLGNSYTVIAIIDNIFMFVFLVAFIVLCFKKSFQFICNIQTKFVKASYYLKAFGFMEYLAWITAMPMGFIIGYNNASLKYNGIETDNPYKDYIIAGFAIYAVILIISLSIATYFAFFKKNSEPLTD